MLFEEFGVFVHPRDNNERPPYDVILRRHI